MNIIIAGDAFGFPNGQGATARVYAYARGLLENDVSVQVVCLRATERESNANTNIDVKGMYDGVPFEYVGGTTSRPHTFYHRRVADLRACLRVWSILRHQACSQKVDAIILLSNSLPWILFAFFMSRLFGAKCIQEKSEFPFVYDKKTIRIRMYSWIFVRTVYKLFDGVIVITTFLEHYFAPLVRKKAKIVRIPILVDVKKFNCPAVVRSAERRIVYAGNLCHEEEVRILLKTVAVLSRRHDDILLQIIGNAHDPGSIGRFKELAKSIGIAERVDFVGMVARNDIPAYLCNATALVLPRAAGVFSQAGFPTKLGEYLATGRPVVVTSTGDIPLYLEDKTNAYLVTPDDDGHFVEQLEKVLSTPEEAMQVGLRGREVARKYFDSYSNCKRLVQFIQDLCS